MADTKTSALVAAPAGLAGDLAYLSRGATDRSATLAALLGPRSPLASHQVAIILDGDSKHLEPGDAINWACARRGLSAPVTVALGVGGSASGSSASAPIGLTHASRLAAVTSAIQAQVAAGRTVYVSLQIGTNDVTASPAVAPSTVMANVEKYHAAVRAAGASGLIITAVNPRTGGVATNRTILQINRLYRTYAAREWFDCILIDPTNYLLDFASSIGDPIGSAANAFGAVTYDGLHQSVNGPLVVSPAYDEVAQAILGRRPAPNFSRADIYDVASVSLNNIIGFDASYNPTGTGRFYAAGGTAGITNSGSGALTDAPPLGWTSSGALSGTASVIMSQQAITLYGQSLPVTRLTFAGTPASNLTLGLFMRSYSQGAASYELQAEFAFYANALAGLQGLGFYNSSSIPGALLGNTNFVYASDGLSKVDGLHRIASVPATVALPFQFDTNLVFYAKAGVPLSGSIDLIKASVTRTGPIPAPTA